MTKPATNRRSELEAGRTAALMADAYEVEGAAAGTTTVRRRLMAQIATRYRDLEALHARLAELLPAPKAKR